jgi:hypothetical protein
MSVNAEVVKAWYTRLSTVHQQERLPVTNKSAASDEEVKERESEREKASERERARERAT